MRILEKSITRETPLVAVEGWYYDGVVKCPEQIFGIPFPEILLIFRNQTVECYRDSHRLRGLPREIAQWSKNNPGKITELYQKVDEGIRFFDNIRITADTSSYRQKSHDRDTFVG